MKSLITLVVLFTALFVMLDAAPLLPSGFQEAAEKQQSDEMAKTFLNIFSKILTSAGDRIGRDGNIQVDKSETRQTLLNATSNFLSALTKKINADPDDEVGQTFTKGANSILSAITKELNSEDGEQSASKHEIGQTFVNAATDLLSALKRNTNPNNEVIQTTLNGWKTIISLLGPKRLENRGEIQSSDNEMKQVFMNLVTSILSKMTDNGEAHSAADEFKRTWLNILKNMISAMRRDANYNNNDLSQIFLDTFDMAIRFLANDGKPDEDELKTILNQLGSLGSELQKKANPKNEVLQLILTFFNMLLSVAKNEIGGGQEEVHVDTLPMYTAKRFDQSMLESMDENAAVDTTAKAKTQLWNAILSSLTSDVLYG